MSENVRTAPTRFRLSVGRGKRCEFSLGKGRTLHDVGGQKPPVGATHASPFLDAKRATRVSPLQDFAGLVGATPASPFRRSNSRAGDAGVAPTRMRRLTHHSSRECPKMSQNVPKCPTFDDAVL